MSLVENIKCVVVGDGMVGKTCLVSCFASNTFPQDHIPTVFDHVEVFLCVDNRPIKLNVQDTAGQEDYDRLRALQYPECELVFICFSLTARDSYANVRDRWYPEVRHHLPSVPVVLVGTKLDLRSKSPDPVTHKEGEKMARAINAAEYIECSAKTLRNVRLVFDKGVRSVISPKKKNSKKPSCVAL